MAIGATSKIDKRLVNLYAEKKTISEDSSDSKISPDEIWNCMSMIATTNQAFMSINNKSFKKMEIA